MSGSEEPLGLEGALLRFWLSGPSLEKPLLSTLSSHILKLAQMESLTVFLISCRRLFRK